MIACGRAHGTAPQLRRCDRATWNGAHNDRRCDMIELLRRRYPLQSDRQTYQQFANFFLENGNLVVLRCTLTSVHPRVSLA